jgi:hypothetical protein
MLRERSETHGCMDEDVVNTSAITRVEGEWNEMRVTVWVHETLSLFVLAGEFRASTTLLLVAHLA